MSLRVKLHEDGKVTLSGIDYRDLRSILTAASLHRYDNPFSPDPSDSEESNTYNKNWLEGQHKLIQWMLKLLDNSIRGQRKEAPKTKAERMREAKERVRERKLINDLIAAAIGKRSCQ